MKVKIYIVTYKRDDVLNCNLESLWASVEGSSDEVAVTVLSNHPRVEIASCNERPTLRTVVNTTRVHNSWGNLARDWNWALLDGFQSWKNPAGTDWVVLAQNDVVWKGGWLDRLNQVNFDLVSQPRGDQAVAINISALNKIGFFDERFSTLHFHEVDFFLRGAIVLKERASINDDHDGMASSFNACKVDMIVPTYSGIMEEEALHTAKFHSELRQYFRHKWGYPPMEAVHRLRDMLNRNACMRTLPAEVDWYPFFWDGIPHRPAGLDWCYAGSRIAVASRRIERFMRRMWRQFRTSRCAR